MDDFAQGSLLNQQSRLAKDPYDGAGKTMWVKVYSPTHTYYDEPATSITAVNLTGTFDILPKHHNFITILQACVLEIGRPDRVDRQRIKISGGLMHVKADRVAVFLDV